MSEQDRSIEDGLRESEQRLRSILDSALRAESDARSHAARLAAVADAQRELAVSDADEPHLTGRIAEMARRLLGADGATYEAIEQGRLRVRGVSGDAAPYAGTELPLDGSLSGLAVLQQHPIVCDDLHTDPRVHWPHPRPSWRSKLAAPLFVGRSTIGVISAFASQPAFFTSGDQNTLELLAESLGAVLQRRRDAERLRASELQYRSLFVDNPQPMCVYDPRSLRVLAVNAAAVAQYGYSETEFLQLTIEHLRPPEDRERIKRDILSQPLHGRRRYAARHQRKNGEVIDVEIFSNDIGFQGRQARVVLGLDVTEQRRAQQEIARFNILLEDRVKQRTEQLQAVNAELEAFSYSIAHDLRSPLTSIDGFSRVLEETYASRLDDQGRHYLRRIQAGVQQMSELTDAMLSLAHLSRVSLRSEPVDLAELARGVFAQLREREPQRDAALEAPRALWARGDPRLLQQVMANLVGNAWKFSGRSPQTFIRVDCETGPAGETVFYVTDLGAGFDMQHAWRLFGAFQRLHAPSEFDGTGIGLALVQKIVTRHGGRIWAKSAPGEGATFFFTLAVPEQG